MTTLTTPLDNKKCIPQYSFSEELACSGRISGLEMTLNGTSLTIQEGLAYVKVEDASGVEFLVKVYLDSALTIPSVTSGTDVIIYVPLANVHNGANNEDLMDIAEFQVVPTGTGGDYHVVLATINSGIVSDVVNSGTYLPGCDFCMRCEGGVLQMPTSNVQGGLTSTSLTTGDIDSIGTVTATTFIGDGSQLSGLAGTDPATYDVAGITEYATLQEMLDCEDNLSITPKILCEYLGCQGAIPGTSFPIQASADSEKNMPTIDGSFYKVKEIQIGYLPSGGSVSVSYQIRKNQSAGSTGFVNGSIRINGVEISKPINPSNIPTPNSYQPVGGPLYTFLPGSDLDFPVQSGDTVELWVAGDPGNSIDSIDVKEFRIYYECANLPRFPTVIID